MVARKTYVKKSKKVYKRSSMPKNFVNKVKSIIYKNAETKQSLLTNGVGTTVLHNVSDRLVSNLMAVQQGVADTLGTTPALNVNRIGDEIQPLGATLYFQFRQPADRPNVTWKIFVLKFGGGAVPPTLLPTKTITNNLLIDPVDTERCSVVSIKTFKHMDNYWTGTTAASKEINFFRKMHIRFPKMRYRFLGDNSGQGKFWNYAVYSVAYDTQGTLITDSLGTIIFNSVLSFKDM